MLIINEYFITNIEIIHIFFNNIVSCFISIHLYILEKVLVDICFHKFKNVLKKLVYWIYQHYFE